MNGEDEFKTCMTDEQIMLVAVLWRDAKGDLAKEVENNA